MPVVCFEHLATSYPLHVYVTVSKNHGYTIGEVIRRKFDPEIRLLIMYYNHQFLLEQKEIEKMNEEQEQMREEVNMSGR